MILKLGTKFLQYEIILKPEPDCIEPVTRSMWVAISAMTSPLYSVKPDTLAKHALTYNLIIEVGRGSNDISDVPRRLSSQNICTRVSFLFKPAPLEI